ncbi:PilN domain-containing protein [Chloroflexota bacterium]
MAVNIVTLDLDSTSIKLLEINGRRIGKWASAPLSQSLVEDGLFSSPELLGAEIRELMQSSGIKGTKVITSLSGLYLISRILHVRKDQKKLSWESLQEAAFEAMPSAGITPSWQVLDRNEDHDRIIVIGVPQDVLSAETRALKAGHLTPAAMDLKSIALTRAVNREQALIINVDSSGYDLVIVTDGIPKIMLADTIPNDTSAEDKAEYLVRSIGQATSFYDSQNIEAPLPNDTPLFLVGQLAEDPVIKEKVQELVPYNIEVFDPPLEVPAHLPKSRYAVNIGLALRVIRPSRNVGTRIKPIDIDVRHGAKKSEGLSLKRMAPYAAVLLGILLAALLYNLTSNALNATEELEYELAGYQMQVDLQKVNLNRVTLLKGEIAEYQAIVNERGHFINLLNLLEGIAPAGVQLTGVRVTKNDIDISGTADTDDQLSYKIALEDTGEFSKVSLPVASSEGGSFSIGVKK